MKRTPIKRIMVFLFLLGIVGAFAVDVRPQPTTTKPPTKKERREAEKLIKQAETAFNQKNYQAAVRGYAAGLAIVPANPDAHYDKGRAHFNLGEFDQAAKEFSLALQQGKKPQQAVLILRWDAYDKLKRYDDALADVKAILASDPQNQRLQLAAARLNYEKGDFAAAAAAYTAALPRAQNQADIYYYIAEAKSRMGDIDGQAEAAQQAINRNTTFLADALNLLGRARYAQNRIPEAIEAYNKSLQSRPEKLESYRQLADLQLSQNLVEEGIKTLEEGRRRNPNNGLAYRDLTLFYAIAANHEEAIAKGTSATQLLPDDPVAHMYLCRAYYQAKRLELAIGSCNSALRLAPGTGESLLYLARATRDLKGPAEAAKIYPQATTSLETYAKDKPEDPDGFFMLGNAYLDMGKTEDALKAYRKTLELNPKFARATFNIGIIYINQNNKAGALEQYNQLLQTDKERARDLKKQIDVM